MILVSLTLIFSKSDQGWLGTMDLMGDNTSLWLPTNVTILITTKNRQKKLEKNSDTTHIRDIRRQPEQ